MKKSAVILSLVLASFGFAAYAEEPQSVKGAFHTGYIPDGFDSNDKVQVVAEGTFPNTCYKSAGFDQKVDLKNKVIEISSNVLKYKGKMCLQMLVPYHQVIDVGLLETGTYTVKDEASGDLGKLSVKLATSSGPDDFLYAPVSQAMIETNANGTFVVVTGQFTNACMQFKDLKVDVQKNVIVVLPIAELADRPDCALGMFPFRKSVKLDSSVPTGRYLLHVRSLNGNAVNNLIDL